MIERSRSRGCQTQRESDHVWCVISRGGGGGGGSSRLREGIREEVTEVTRKYGREKESERKRAYTAARMRRAVNRVCVCPRTSDGGPHGDARVCISFTIVSRIERNGRKGLYIREFFDFVRGEWVFSCPSVVYTTGGWANTVFFFRVGALCVYGFAVRFMGWTGRRSRRLRRRMEKVRKTYICGTGDGFAALMFLLSRIKRQFTIVIEIRQSLALISSRRKEGHKPLRRPKDHAWCTYDSIYRLREKKVSTKPTQQHAYNEATSRAQIRN